MTANLVMGLQWGDEGKGRVVDHIARRADIVVRFNGGPNAGHTIPLSNGLKIAVHQLPSGVTNPNATLCMGRGMVVDIFRLMKEITEVEANIKRIILDPKAQVIAPCHPMEDGAAETARGDQAIGTTRTGNGPAYADKYARVGLTVGDLLALASTRSAALRLSSGRPGRSHGALEEWAKVAANALRGMINDGLRVADVSEYLRIHSDEKILFEAAHGWELDIDHGDYPFVTSSSCGLSGVGSGAGFPIKEIKHVTGVIKPYSTRIGAGPFVTEYLKEEADRIREKGGEFGVTTGRPRKIGVLDLRRISQACRLNSVDRLAMTHLDIAIGIGSVPYIDQDGTITRASWHEIGGIIEEATGASIQYISDGPQHQCMQQFFGEEGSDADIWRLH